MSNLHVSYDILLSGVVSISQIQLSRQDLARIVLDESVAGVVLQRFRRHVSVILELVKVRTHQESAVLFQLHKARLYQIHFSVDVLFLQGCDQHHRVTKGEVILNQRHFPCLYNALLVLLSEHLLQFEVLQRVIV